MDFNKIEYRLVANYIFSGQKNERQRKEAR